MKMLQNFWKMATKVFPPLVGYIHLVQKQLPANIIVQKETKK
jgi:hypothetical protein